ncbi:hypothetical protein [Spirulina sp. 06S082]|uniref:hypothetical protein n=1 Tax=Spirulina sp. 06S082 TaxID=3110248 RepID=UPI002B2085E0|nr:hypothetical protein [Spirulina sp. 06S082]MEA5471963.1 hypothetical protein [Spirulina sp. 06S082]
MKALRWFCSIFLALILAIALIVFLPTTAIVQQITNVQTVKVWFNESNAYDDVLASAFQEKLQEMVPQIGNFPLSGDRQLFGAIVRSLPDDFVENTFETILDAHFDYFHGRKDRVEFTINLTDITQSLNPNPPICPPGTPPESCASPPINPARFNLSQLPNNGISDKLTLTEKDIKLDDENLADIRKFFTIATLIPRFAYGIILFISISILAIAPRRWRNGLFILGFTWLSSTILVGLIALGSRATSLSAIQTQLNSTIVQEEPIAGTLLLKVAIIAHASIMNQIIFLSGVGIIFGLICLAIATIRWRTFD